MAKAAKAVAKPAASKSRQVDEVEDMDEMELEGELEVASDAPAAERAPAHREEDIYTIAAKQRMRERMEADVQAFLKRGGAINQIDPNVMADPPRRPSVAYGSRPI